MAGELGPRRKHGGSQQCRGGKDRKNSLHRYCNHDPAESMLGGRHTAQLPRRVKARRSQGMRGQKTAAFRRRISAISWPMPQNASGAPYIETIPPPRFIVLYLELAIVTVLIVINGLLSMSELAIVSDRKSVV